MGPQNFINRNCPLCGTSKNSRRYVCSQPAAEGLAYEALIPHWNGFFKDKIFFSYDRCSDCELLFAPITFNAGQLEALYRQMAPNMDLVPISALRATQRGYFKALERHKPPIGGFLEMGPDIGLFTENCVHLPKFNEYWLFEPNVDVHDQLKKVVADHKHHILTDMFSYKAVPDGSLSCAVFIHVLDHLLDPVTTLKELRRKLMPNGKLLVVTHNEGSLMPRIIGARWPAFCLQHPQIYSMASMKNLMRKTGYQVLEQSRSTNYFPLSFLTRHALWSLGFKVTNFPTFFDPTLGLKLGNMLTVATPN